MDWIKGVFGAAVALASAQAAAQDNEEARSPRAEAAIGLLAHGMRKPFRSAPPPGFDLYEGEEERGTRTSSSCFKRAFCRSAEAALDP